MPWVDRNIRSTFPIPKQEVSRRKWRMALGHPVSWMPFLPLAAAATAVGPGGRGFLIGTAAMVAGALGIFWKRKWKKLENPIVEQIIAESNMAQDSELIRLIRKLARNGYQSYAVTLGSFAGLKTKIERATYDGGEHDAQREQVGKLIDELVFNVVDHLEEMAKIEYRLTHAGRPSPPPGRAAELQDSWQQMSSRVQAAYETLRGTWHNLDVLLDPVPDEHAAGDQLEDTIEQLREENRIAGEIRRRFMADRAANASLPEEDAEADAEIESSFSGLSEDGSSS